MDPWGQLAHLSKQELQELQNSKLHTFINTHLYPFSPYYQKLFDQQKINPKNIKTVADLKHLPFTSKLNFIDPNNPDEYRNFILQPDKVKIRKYWPPPKLLSLAVESAVRGKTAIEEKLS